MTTIGSTRAPGAPWQEKNRMMPKRIQRRRARGWKMPPNAVYVGRPSRWGNPFRVGVDGTAEECVTKYIQMMHQLRKSDPQQFEELMAPLRGKDLCCWCPHDQRCHGNALLIMTNSWELLDSD